jgi:hypothetical protein
MDESREWKHIPWSVKLQLVDLQHSNYSFPPRAAEPTTTFNIMRSFFEDILQAFRDDPTPGLASVVQQAASHLITASSQIYARPGPEYRALFTTVTNALQEVQSTAARMTK